MRKIYTKELPRCVGVVGSRSFAKSEVVDKRMREIVRRFVYELDERSEIVSGGARGVDTYAVDAAKLRGMRFKEYLPDDKLGWPRAAVVRNQQIVNHLANTDGVLIAFADEQAMNGTNMTIEMAAKALVPFIVMYFTPRGRYVRVIGAQRYLTTDEKEDTIE